MAPRCLIWAPRLDVQSPHNSHSHQLPQSPYGLWDWTYRRRYWEVGQLFPFIVGLLILIISQSSVLGLNSACLTKKQQKRVKGMSFVRWRIGQSARPWLSNQFQVCETAGDTDLILGGLLIGDPAYWATSLSCINAAFQSPDLESKTRMGLRGGGKGVRIAQVCCWSDSGRFQTAHPSLLALVCSPPLSAADPELLCVAWVLLFFLDLGFSIDCPLVTDLRRIISNTQLDFMSSGTYFSNSWCFSATLLFLLCLSGQIRSPPSSSSSSVMSDDDNDDNNSNNKNHHHISSNSNKYRWPTLSRFSSCCRCFCELFHLILTIAWERESSDYSCVKFLSNKVKLVGEQGSQDLNSGWGLWKAFSHPGIPQETVKGCQNCQALLGIWFR